jgi:hypothetical protein
MPFHSTYFSADSKFPGVRKIKLSVPTAVAMHWLLLFSNQISPLKIDIFNRKHFLSCQTVWSTLYVFNSPNPHFDLWWDYMLSSSTANTIVFLYLTDVQTLDTMQALCLPLGASVSLLVMFFFFDSMQILFALCTAGKSSKCSLSPRKPDIW